MEITKTWFDEVKGKMASVIIPETEFYREPVINMGGIRAGKTERMIAALAQLPPMQLVVPAALMADALASSDSVVVTYAKNYCIVASKLNG